MENTKVLEFTNEQIKRFKSKKSNTVSEDGFSSCIICDKTFYIPDSNVWSYKITNTAGIRKLCCSWSCLRKADKLRSSIKINKVRGDVEDDEFF